MGGWCEGEGKDVGVGGVVERGGRRVKGESREAARRKESEWRGGGRREERGEKGRGGDCTHPSHSV